MLFQITFQIFKPFYLTHTNPYAEYTLHWKWQLFTCCLMLYSLRLFLWISYIHVSKCQFRFDWICQSGFQNKWFMRNVFDVFEKSHQLMDCIFLCATFPKKLHSNVIILIWGFPSSLNLFGIKIRYFAAHYWI